MAEHDSRPGDSDVPSRFHIDFGGRTLLGIDRVDREIAQGGMGSVYLAQDTNLGRRVVVKVPHVRFLGEPGFRSRFRRIAFESEVMQGGAPQTFRFEKGFAVHARRD